jgi:hypothetical protein
MRIHLRNDISHLIKLSFNTPNSTRGLDALLGLQENWGRGGLHRAEAGGRRWAGDKVGRWATTVTDLRARVRVGVGARSRPGARDRVKSPNFCRLTQPTKVITVTSIGW